MKTELVREKFVISGDIIEYYQYSEGYLKGYQGNRGSGRKKDEKSDDYEINRSKVLDRAKKMLRRKINANADGLVKFLTLTFAKNEMDLDYCNYEFKKFIERLKTWCKTKDIKLQYVVVVEFQERGAVHYHMLCNLPYIKAKTLGDIWGNGFIKINRIDRVDNVGAYVCKYMQKDLSDTRLEGRKCYFTSRNLSPPVEVTDKKLVESVKSSLLVKNLKYVTEFSNEHLGNVQYKQFNSKYVNTSIASIVGDMKFYEFDS